MFRSAFVAVCILAGPMASLASAATFQVGPGRTHRQVSDVAGLLNPGDIVEVDGNATYGPVTFDRPGTSAQPITIRGLRVNGVRPTLAGSDANGFTLFMRTRSVQMGYYLIEGFEITGGTQACVRNQARDVAYRDIKVYNCPRHGLLSHDFNSGNLSISFAEFTGIGGTYAGENTKHPIYVTSSQDTLPGSVCRVQYTYVHDNVSGDSIKSRCERNEIYFNWLQGAPFYEMELIGPDEGSGGMGRPCHSDIVGNVIFSHHAYPIRMGSDAADSSFGRYRLANNTIIAWDAGGGGISRHLGVIESIEFYNNIIYSNATSALRLHRVDGSWLSTEVITGRNNWMSSNITTSGLVAAAGATLIAASQRGTQPGFANAGSVAAFDPRLVSSSPAINAGTPNNTNSNSTPIPNPLTAVSTHPPYRLSTDLRTLAPTVRPVSGAIDLGAFESGTAAPVIPPTAPSNVRLIR
jgi:hypothetical protein